MGILDAPARGRKTLAGTLYAQNQPPAFPTGRILTGAYCNLASQGSAEIASHTYREGQLGRTHDIGSHFHSWASTDWPGNLESDDVAKGRIPLVAWNGTTLTAILDGSSDAYITGVAQRCAAFGWPMFLRWGWEMNGNWYTWSGPQNGSDPRVYIRAYQRIWNLFKASGASNVSWVWCPNPSSSPGGTTVTDANNWRYYYPGDDYVDVVATDIYNWGDYDVATHGSWTSLRSLLAPFTNDWAAGLGGRMVTTKPLMIAEIAGYTSPGNKPHWLADAMGFLRGVGASAVVAFDTDASTSAINWKMDSSADALVSWKEFTQAPSRGGRTIGGGTYRNTVLSDGPYVYLPLNDTGSTFTDYGSAAITTAIVEAVHTALNGRVPGPRPGVPSGVSSAGGGGVSVGVVTGFGSAMGSGFTIEFLWRYGASGVALAAAQEILGVLNTGTTTGLGIAVNSSGSFALSAGATVFWLRNEAGTARITTFSGAQALTALYDGKWHHVAWVCDPAALTDIVYVDGAAVTATSTPGSATAGTFVDFGFPLTLLERNNRASFDLQAIGAISNLALFRSKLGSPRVADHYAASTA